MRRSIYIVLLLLLSLVGWAQQGEQFWFAGPEMSLHSRDMSLRLYVITDDEEACIKCYMPAKQGYAPRTLRVGAHSVGEIVLAETYEEYMGLWALPYNRVSDRALCIESDKPVSCYVQMTGVNGETYTLKGKNGLGTSFLVASQNKYRNSNARTKSHLYDAAYSSFQVVASEDSTEIDIVPSSEIWERGTAPLHLVLHRGESYSFRSAHKFPWSHLNGTRIEASKPVSVFTMDDSMSPYQQYFGEDAVAEQLVPVALLGNEYIALSNGLHWEGVTITDIETSETEFISMDSMDVLYIHREQPVQVFQITGYGNEAGGTQLPSLSSGSYRVRYQLMHQSSRAKIHILTPTEGRDSISINGQFLDGRAFKLVEQTPEWSYTTIDADVYRSKSLDIASRQSPIQVSVVDALMGTGKGSRVVPTSCSYGYFSGYATAMEVESALVEMHGIAECTGFIQDDYQLSNDSILSPKIQSSVIDTVMKKEKHHFLNIYVEGGYSHIPYIGASSRWGLGYGAGIGLMYEYQKEHFMLDVGVGFLWQDVEHRLASQSFSQSLTDEAGDAATLQYSVNRQDRSRLGYLEVPVLVGSLWEWFYLMGGVKVGVPLFGNTESYATISNAQIYDQYFVPLENMPNHGLRFNEPVRSFGDRLDYWVDSRLSLELGINFGAFRMGAFVDGGVLWPLRESSAASLVINDLYNYSTWEQTHVLRTTEASNTPHFNFLTGIKFTVNWGL